MTLLYQVCSCLPLVTWDAVKLVGLDDDGLAHSLDLGDSVCDWRDRKKNPGSKVVARLLPSDAQSQMTTGKRKCPGVASRPHWWRVRTVLKFVSTVLPFIREASIASVFPMRKCFEI